MLSLLSKVCGFRKVEAIKCQLLPACKPLPAILKMRRTAIIINFFLLTTILNGCFIGAGTHGKIKDYHFDNSNEEIVSIVDIFLTENPEYYDDVLEDFGWVYIKIPSTNDKFGFSIGGLSEIVLIAAGNLTETKWDKDLGFFERKRLIKSFEKNFIEKLKDIKPRKVTLLKEPFVLTVNQDIDTIMWPHYVFKYDTLVSYPLPNEFESSNVDLFEDLISSFAKGSNQNIEINQYYNIFRINKDYSGFISDSIYITAYYRVIGQEKTYKTIFNTQKWTTFISKGNCKNRLDNYRSIRKEKVNNGYAETDVYSEFSQELWMLDNDKLEKKNGR